MTKVILATQVWLNPWAECRGDGFDVDGGRNCQASWPSSRNTLTDIKSHIRDNPGHEVLVVHEKRSVYAGDQ